MDENEDMGRKKEFSDDAEVGQEFESKEPLVHISKAGWHVPPYDALGELEKQSEPTAGTAPSEAGAPSFADRYRKGADFDAVTYARENRQEMPQEKPFGVVRQIWRAIYPALIYIFGAAFVAGIVAAILAAVVMVREGIIPTDTFALTEMSMEILAQYMMPMMLAGHIAVLAAYIPMWRATQRRYKLWSGGRINVVTGLILTAFSLCVYFALSYAVSLARMAGAFGSYDVIETSLTNGSVLMQALTIGLSGPIVEELCFRGITQNRLSNMNRMLAVLIQAVLFGVAHMNWLQGLYAFVFGFILGYLYTEFRTIIVPIIGHIVFNMANVVLAALLGGAETSAVEEPITPATVVTLIVLILIASGAAFGLFKVLMKRRPPRLAAEAVAAETDGYAEPWE